MKMRTRRYILAHRARLVAPYSSARLAIIAHAAASERMRYILAPFIRETFRQLVDALREPAASGTTRYATGGPLTIYQFSRSGRVLASIPAPIANAAFARERRRAMKQRHRRHSPALRSHIAQGRRLRQRARMLALSKHPIINIQFDISGFVAAIDDLSEKIKDQTDPLWRGPMQPTPEATT